MHTTAVCFLLLTVAGVINCDVDAITHSERQTIRKRLMGDLETAQWIALAAFDRNGRPDECEDVACGMLDYKEIGRRKKNAGEKLRNSLRRESIGPTNLYDAIGEYMESNAKTSHARPRVCTGPDCRKLYKIPRILRRRIARKLFEALQRRAISRSSWRHGDKTSSLSKIHASP